MEEIVICEIDKDVIEVSKKFLPTLACGYDDPRVSVKVREQKLKFWCNLTIPLPQNLFLYNSGSMTMYISYLQLYFHIDNGRSKVYG